MAERIILDTPVLPGTPAGRRLLQQAFLRVAQLVAGAAAFRILLQGHKRVGRLRRRIGLIALGTLAARSLYQTLRSIISDYITLNTQPFRENARTALAAAFVVLTDGKKMSLDPAPIGLHAFIIQRSIKPPRYYLERAATLRLAHMPPPSGIIWTRGKGVIGRCWAEQRIVAMPTGQLYAKVTAKSPEEWDQLSNDIRLNLTYSEFSQIRGKYSGVIAVPIFDQTKAVRGCVALDSVGSEPFDDLMREDVYEVLQDAAVAIGRDLSRVPPWVYPPGEELRDG